MNAVAKESKISFNAFRTELEAKPGLSSTSFSATIVELPRPGFSVFRSINATADSAAFSVVSSHGHVDEATVTPPAPFSGSATYGRAAASESESWVGSLAGDFPGLGVVSLAGPGFCAEGTVLGDCRGATAWFVVFG